MAKLLGLDPDDPKQAEELAKRFREELLKGKSVKEILDMPPEALESLYSLAYQKYRAGDYNDAAELFRQLVIFDAHDYRYLLGLAASLQKLEEWGAAASCYLLASMEHSKDPTPYFHGATCFLNAGEPRMAFAFLAQAIHWSGDDERFAKLKERAKIMRDALKKQID